MKKIQVLRELHKIIEYKKGAIYKTKYIEDVWIDLPAEGQPIPPKDFLYVTKSDADITTIRTV